MHTITYFQSIKSLPPSQTYLVIQRLCEWNDLSHYKDDDVGTIRFYKQTDVSITS